MEHDLLTYLLHGLEPDEERAVEDQLEADPALRQELRQWRGLLDPLNYYASPEPPPTLYIDTLRVIAHEMSHTRSSNYPSRDHVESGGHWWRRVNVLVAASVLLVLGLLLPPLLLYFRHQRDILACQDNLRRFHRAYEQYWTDHQGELPNLGELPENLRMAGMHPVMLREKKCWDKDISLICPGNGSNHILQPQHRDDVKKLLDENKDPHWREHLGGQYAFPLGYFEGKNLLGLQKGMGEYTPILSDRPPRRSEQPSTWSKANSPNHGGKGQNVLFLGGHAKWINNRLHNGSDDMFLNRDGKLAAGINAQDIVLAPSETPPLPSSTSSD